MFNPNFQDYHLCIHLSDERRCLVGCTQNYVSDEKECKQYHGVQCEKYEVYINPQLSLF